MNPLPKPVSGERSLQLDGLRGVAILLVFFHHSGLKLPHWWDWGQMGVRVFFVLTGYLITLSLWKIAAKSAAQGGGHWKELGVFHLRRCARLLPAFYIGIAMGAVIGLRDVIEPIFWHLTFLSNFKMAAQGYFFGPTGHFWSLALQEQFYILWPFVVLLVPFKWFPFVLGIAFFLGFGYRVACYWLDVSQYYRWIMLPGSMDTFAIGGFLAWLKASRGLPRLPEKTLHAGGLFAVVVVLWFSNRWIRTEPMGALIDSLPEILEGLCAAYLLIGSVQGWKGLPGWVLGWKPLQYLGRISYGVFVYHLLILWPVEQWLKPTGFGPYAAPVSWSLVMLAVTIAVASASWHWIEQPISKKARSWLG